MGSFGFSFLGPAVSLKARFLGNMVKRLLTDPFLRRWSRFKKPPFSPRFQGTFLFGPGVCFSLDELFPPLLCPSSNVQAEIRDLADHLFCARLHIGVIFGSGSFVHFSTLVRHRHFAGRHRGCLRVFHILVVVAIRVLFDSFFSNSRRTVSQDLVLGSSQSVLVSVCLRFSARFGWLLCLSCFPGFRPVSDHAFSLARCDDSNNFGSLADQFLGHSCWRGVQPRPHYVKLRSSF